MPASKLLKANWEQKRSWHGPWGTPDDDIGAQSEIIPLRTMHSLQFDGELVKSASIGPSIPFFLTCEVCLTIVPHGHAGLAQKF